MNIINNYKIKYWKFNMHTKEIYLNQLNKSSLLQWQKFS